MRQAESPCVITGVRLGEMEVNFHSLNPILKAKFMLVDENGESYGAANFSSIWSEETRQAFVSLVESMERDALTVIFKKPDTKKEEELEQF